MALYALDLAAGRAPARTASRGTFYVAGVVRVALAALLIGQLGRIPVFSAGAKDAPVLVNDLLVGAIVVVGMLLALRTRKLEIDWTSGFALAFASVGGISAALAIPRFGLTPFEFIFSIAYLARWVVYFAIYVVVANFVRVEDVRGIWRTFVGTVVAFAVFGLFQAALLPDFALMVYPDAIAYTDWDPQGNRLVSTWLDPNYAGAVIAMALLVSLSLVAFGERVEPWWLLVLFAGLAVTLSRGSILSFGVGVCVIVAGRGVSRRLMRIAVVLVLLAIPLVPPFIRYGMMYNKFMVDASAMTRVVGWIVGLDTFSRHPIIGVGFNTFGFVRLRGNAPVDIVTASFGLDGGLLMIAVLTGTVGLTLFVAMFASVIVRCRKLWRNTELPAQARGLALGTAAASVTIVFHGFFLNTLTYPLLLEPLWVLWALTRLLAAQAPAPIPVGGS